MKTPIFIRIAVSCVIAMVLSATQWLPLKVSFPLGTGALAVAVLSAIAWILRLAAEKKKAPASFFIVGLFLLLVAYPETRTVTSLFLPAGERSTGGEAPVEIVFGLLSIACIFRAWILWSTNDEEA